MSKSSGVISALSGVGLVLAFVFVLVLRAMFRSGEGWVAADDAGGKEDTELCWVTSTGGEVLLGSAYDGGLMEFDIADVCSEPGTVKAWLMIAWDASSNRPPFPDTTPLLLSTVDPFSWLSRGTRHRSKTNRLPRFLRDRCTRNNSPASSIKANTPPTTPPINALRSWPGLASAASVSVAGATA